MSKNIAVVSMCDSDRKLTKDTEFNSVVLIHSFGSVQRRIAPGNCIVNWTCQIVNNLYFKLWKNFSWHSANIKTSHLSGQKGLSVKMQSCGMSLIKFILFVFNLVFAVSNLRYIFQSLKYNKKQTQAIINRFSNRKWPSTRFHIQSFRHENSYMCH